MSNPLLIAENVHKAYQMGRVRLDVLHGCSLQVDAGEFVAIMGKSGSGKSTLLHILGALDAPQRGQVHFDGQPVFADEERAGRLRAWARPGANTTNGHGGLLARMLGLIPFARILLTDVFERRPIQLRRHTFGFVFQFYHLLPELNVLENVLLTRMVGISTRRWLSGNDARSTARQEALAVLERVGLSDRLKHRPAELSGGERQRVAIARALIHKPRILFADEPTGNLDAEAGGRIMQLLDGLHREGQTIVMVTHDTGVALYADRTLHLVRGVLQRDQTAQTTDNDTSPPA